MVLYRSAMHSKHRRESLSTQEKVSKIHKRMTFRRHRITKSEWPWSLEVIVFLKPVW